MLPVLAAAGSALGRGLGAIAKGAKAAAQGLMKIGKTSMRVGRSLVRDVMDDLTHAAKHSFGQEGPDWDAMFPDFEAGMQQRQGKYVQPTRMKRGFGGGEIFHVTGVVDLTESMALSVKRGPDGRLQQVQFSGGSEADKLAVMKETYRAAYAQYAQKNEKAGIKHWEMNVDVANGSVKDVQRSAQAMRELQQENPGQYRNMTLSAAGQRVDIAKPVVGHAATPAQKTGGRKAASGGMSGPGMGMSPKPSMGV